MSRYRKILVAIDFSEGSTEALRHAVDLAVVFGGTVDVLHVWEPTPAIPGDTMLYLDGAQLSLSEHMHASTTRRLNALVQEVAGDMRCIGSQRVAQGRIADTLVEVLEQGDYDLAVLGTHSRTGLSYLVLGSVAARVVRMAPCAVLTVKAPTAPAASD